MINIQNIQNKIKYRHVKIIFLKPILHTISFAITLLQLHIQEIIICINLDYFGYQWHLMFLMEEVDDLV